MGSEIQSPPSHSPSLIIGLTGGIGSGKSTVAALFQQSGAHYVDADNVARQVVEPGSTALNAIVEKFGTAILAPNQQLNRTALRTIIFNDHQAKVWLERLLHPLIRQSLLAQVHASVSPYTLLVAPLLFENGLDRLVQRTLVIDVSEPLQVARTCARDQNTVAQVHAIMASQLPRLVRLTRADDIIDNNGDDVMLRAQVHYFHKKYLELTQQIRHK